MKFVPSLGRALKEMILDGKSDFARPEFAITRKDKEGKGIVFDGPVVLEAENGSSASVFRQKGGDSMRRMGY